MFTANKIFIYYRKFLQIKLHFFIMDLKTRIVYNYLGVTFSLHVLYSKTLMAYININTIYI